MLINRYQPIEKLLNLVEKKFYHDLDFILDILDPNKKQNVTADLETLGYIHHALNLDQYKKPEFRKKLFESIPPNMQIGYFKKCGIALNVPHVKKVKQAIGFEWGQNTQTKNFVDFFRYPKYMLPLEKEKKERKLEPLKMLFDYQSDVVFRTLRIIEDPFKRALIQMPTGTGKTLTAVDIITRLLNQKDKQIQILWFAHSTELLDQAYEAFVDVWKHVGNSKIKIIKFWGSEAIPKIPKEKCIFFIGYQKFRPLKGKLNPDYIFLDETHKILAPKFKEIVESLIDYQKGTRVVGLTATPGRGINDIQNELLLEWFRDTDVPMRIPDEKKADEYEGNIVKYLEDEDVLSKVIPEKIYSDFEYELSEDEWKRLKTLVEGDHPDWSLKFLKLLANDNLRNKIIVDALKKYANEGKKILYFSTDKTQTKLVYAALQKLGVSAVYVEDETDKTFRKQVIEIFKKTDEISVICNFNIFATGFDVPDLDVVFIGRPINSPVLFNQMVGRGTRGEKIGGKPTFTLAQVIDKIKSPFEDFDPYEQYGFWDKYWRQ